MSKSRKSTAATIARYLLGLMFFVFGLNGFLHFIPQPPHAGGAGAYLGALAGTGYMFPLIKSTEVIVGALLLANRYVALALTLLAPIVINIVAFHLFLDPSGLPVALLALALGLYLAWTERAVYAPLFASRGSAEVAPAHDVHAVRANV